MARKICVKCGKRKNKKSFPRHIRYKDGFDTRCKKCVKSASKIRAKLHKKSIDKPGNCPVCTKLPSDFKKPNKWHLDHDPESNKFRGWLCEPCNMSLGLLGDNVIGIVRALNYLLDTKEQLSIDEIEILKLLLNKIRKRIPIDKDDTVWYTD